MDEVFIDKKMKLSNAPVDEALSVTIDKKYAFNCHVEHICKKTDNKRNALARMAIKLSPFKNDSLFISFVQRQFSYCPLLWMFCSYSSNNLTDKINQKALCLNSEMNDNFFNELLSIKNEVSINENLQTLSVEVYKNFNGLVSTIMLDLFETMHNRYIQYDLMIYIIYIYI